MGMISDFRAFALKGNVIDLAVGVIIGAAFGRIVTALVDDILMPLIGLATGGTKFNDRFAVLKYKEGAEGTVYKSLAEAKAGGANVFAYGDFIQTVFDFLIIAFCIFMIVRMLERARRKKEAAPAAEVAPPSATDQLLTEIRDELRRGRGL
jgi:large conductance mechanosensitive channel